MARAKAATKKAAKKKVAKKRTTRKRAPQKRAPTKPPAQNGNPNAQGEGPRVVLALPHGIRDAIITLLSEELPMKKAEGAVTMLRQLPEVQIQ